MSKILVTLAVVDAALATGAAAFLGINVSVTDAGGAEQSKRLDGSESPPFSAQFDIANEGDGNVVAEAVDVNGAPIPDGRTEQGFSTGVVEPPPPEEVTFKKPVGIIVTPVA